MNKAEKKAFDKKVKQQDKTIKKACDEAYLNEHVISVKGVKYVRKVKYDKLERCCNDLAFNFESLICLIEQIDIETRKIQRTSKIKKRASKRFDRLIRKYKIPYQGSYYHSDY